MTAVLRDRSGRATALDLDRWRGSADAVEQAIIAGVPDPVLDVGCGPGRLVAAVTAAGRRAMGIDPSPAAVDEAAARGAVALCRSVFDPLPGEGRWGAALLVDGNVGIGGDPVALLARVASLLRRGGHVVVEVDAPGSPTEVVQARIEHADGRIGPWFPWARVGADRVEALLGVAGLLPVEIVRARGRWFARSVRP